MRKRYILLFAILILNSFSSFAKHIVGGELNYRYLGNNQYQITLKLYRDANSTTYFDTSLNIVAYDAFGRLASYVTLRSPVITDLQVSLSNSCLTAPPNVKVQEADYVGVITLAPISGGYDLVYQRCCRNVTISNLFIPGGQGATYVAHIPDPIYAVSNSNPYFNSYPPIAICINEQLEIDGSATDLDGDSLSYSLCSPLQGADSLMPVPLFAPPPPYDSVVYVPPFNSSQPLGDPGQLQINRNTGLMTVNARFLGQYVVGICVKEYRNGNLLSSHVRDFQFNVVTCKKEITADFGLENSVLKGDTLVLCNSRQAVFTNLSSGASNYVWHFKQGSSELDSTVTSAPTYTFPSYGLFQVELVAGPGIPCADSTAKWLLIDTLPSFQFASLDTCGNHGNRFVVNLGGIAAGLEFNWNFGDGMSLSTSLVDVSHQYQTGGNYTVTLTMSNADGCSAVYAQSIPVVLNLANFNAPGLTALGDTMLSCNNRLISFSNQSNNTNVKWLFGNKSAIFDSSLNQNVAETFPSAGLYRIFLIVNPNIFCSDTLMKWLRIDSVPTPNMQWLFNCTSRYTQFSLSNIESGNISSVHWNFGDGDSTTAGLNTSHKFSKPGIYDCSIIITDAKGCSVRQENQVEIDSIEGLEAGPDTTIRIGESIQLFAQGLDSVIWIPPTFLDNQFSNTPTASPLQDITYLVRPIDTSQCYPLAYVTLRVDDESLIAVPNAFTPNGDGINDYLKFYTQGIQHFIAMAIFDRWGNQVFYTTDPNIFWDGTYKGKYCETGSYAYYIKGETYDGHEINQRGMITLIR